MPSGGEGAEDAALQLLQLIGAQKAWELVYGAFDRGDDVPCEQFGQIVEEPGEEVVDPACGAGSEGKAEEIRVTRNEEHVPKHGGFRYAGRVGPADLKAELAAQFGETPQGCGRIAEKGVPLYELVHAAQIGQGVEPLGEGFGNGLVFFVKRIEWLDDVVFPPRSVKVGRREDAIREARPIPVPVVGGKALPETFIRRAEHGAELFEYPFRQFFVIFLVFTDAVKYWGLDVRCDQTVQIIEKPPFYNFLLQFTLIWGRITPAVQEREHPGDNHFMRLLVYFVEFHGTQFVVPAAHVRTGKHKL